MAGYAAWMARAGVAVVALWSAAGCSSRTHAEAPVTAERQAPPAREPALECSLSVPPRVRAGEPVILRFRLRNPTGQPLAVLSWNTPLEGLFGDYLQVTRDGTELPYAGPMVKRGDPEADSYVTVAPGASAEAQVEVSLAYDMKQPGRYRLEMQGALLDVAPPASVPRSREQHHSLPLQCPPVEMVVEAP